MKITFFGLTISSSWGNGHATPLRAVLRALAGMGHEITFFERDATYYAQHRDLPEPKFSTLRIYDDWLNVRREALQCVRSSDVVVTTSYLPEGGAVLDELLAIEGPMFVYYDLDTPVTISTLRLGGEPEYVAPHQLSAFDLVLSFTGGKTLDILRNEHGVRRAEALYGCVDPDVHYRTERSNHFGNDFGYLGTYAHDRHAKLEKFFFGAARRLPQQKFMVVGSMFPEGMNWPVNVWYKPHAAPTLHPAFYSSSRATLNITRQAMADFGHCPSGRFFEAAACGTPVISDRFAGIEEFFDREREIAVVDSTEDVVAALSRSDADLRAMAERARQRTLDEHTGAVRARQMIAAIERAALREQAEAA